MCLNIDYKWIFVTSTTHNGAFNTIYRNFIAHNVGDISGIMWKNVFSTDMPYFSDAGSPLVIILENISTKNVYYLNTGHSY